MDDTTKPNTDALPITMIFTYAFVAISKDIKGNCLLNFNTFFDICWMLFFRGEICSMNGKRPTIWIWSKRLEFKESHSKWKKKRNVTSRKNSFFAYHGWLKHTSNEKYRFSCKMKNVHYSVSHLHFFFFFSLWHFQ